jgi:hypothetical protein
MLYSISRRKLGQRAPFAETVSLRRAGLNRHFSSLACSLGRYHFALQLDVSLLEGRAPTPFIHTVRELHQLCKLGLSLQARRRLQTGRCKGEAAGHAPCYATGLSFPPSSKVLTQSCNCPPRAGEVPSSPRLREHLFQLGLGRVFFSDSRSHWHQGSGTACLCATRGTGKSKFSICLASGPL